jgi:hypothetical protein
MLSWDHNGGFSLDGTVLIEGCPQNEEPCGSSEDGFARDRQALDRLLRYWKKPSHDGKAYLVMAPLELLQRLAAIIPPPRTNLVRYFGVLAPNAALREKVVSSAGPSAALFEQLISAAQQMDLEVELDRGGTQSIDVCTGHNSLERDGDSMPAGGAPKPPPGPKSDARRICGPC